MTGTNVFHFTADPRKLSLSSRPHILNCRRTMYCLQWLIPVLLIPKPVPAGLLHNHVVFMVLYLTGFFLERKPCTICSLVFLAAVTVLCYSGIGNCLLWPTADCQGESSGSNELCGRGG